MLPPPPHHTLVPSRRSSDLRVNLRTRRPGDRQLRTGRMEDLGQDGGIARFGAERDDVLDRELDRIADRDRMRAALLAHRDRRPLDPEGLADERPDSFHRTAE